MNLDQHKPRERSAGLPARLEQITLPPNAPGPEAGAPFETNSFAIVARTELPAQRRAEMFALLQYHFAGVTPEQFARDLAEKNWIVLILRGDRLVGFSTLHVYETQFDAEPVSVVYSGDTIVAPEAWGSTALARGWITAVNQLRELYPRGKYYWLLLTSGFRTYRFLPVFWREFFPRFDAPLPDDLRRLRDQLAAERFGPQYNSATGLVRFRHPQQLRGELKSIPAGRLTDPHIAFFAQCNPGHDQGDELVCLTELSAKNLTAAGRRMAVAAPRCARTVSERQKTPPQPFVAYTTKGCPDGLLETRPARPA
jgi:hypothetical protein